MVSATRKRILLLLVVIVLTFLLIRYLLYNGTLLAVSINRYPQQTQVIQNKQQLKHETTHVGLPFKKRTPINV